ncbi:MAG: TolC family protein [Desulfobacter sp.]
MKLLIKTTLMGALVWLGLAWPVNAGKEPAPETGKTVGRNIEVRASLADLLTYAYETNPSVTASRQSWKAFIENYRLGTSYPDPQLAATYFPSPIETRLGPQDWNLTLSQAVPFPGTLSRKGEVLASDVAISRLKVDKTVKLLVRDLSIAYYELLYIRDAMEIARANQGLNQRLGQIGDNAYALDRAKLYDISKARAQAAQIRYDIHLLEEREQTEKARINTLLNRPPSAALGPAVPLGTRDPVYSLEAVYELAMAHQEDIRMADLAFERSKAAVRLAAFENLPSFKFGLFYAGIGRPDTTSQPPGAGDDAVGIQFGLNLPIQFGKNSSRKAKALALKEKARADRAAAANKIKEEISRLWFKLENSKRLVSLYQNEMLPQALDQVSTAGTWVEQGLGSFSDFLEIQSTAYNFQLALARARADYGQTLVRLEQLAGVVLDRKQAVPEEQENRRADQ